MQYTCIKLVFCFFDLSILVAIVSRKRIFCSLKVIQMLWKVVVKLLWEPLLFTLFPSSRITRTVKSNIFYRGLCGQLYIK